MYLAANSMSFIQNRTLSIREKLKQYYPPELIQDFFLRAETFLEDGKSSYELLLGKDAGKTAGATERLLQTNDAFAPVGLALRVKKATFVNNREFPGNDKLLSFVDSAVFDAAAVGDFSEAQCMQGVYNSDLALYADGKELLYKIDTSALEFIYDIPLTADRTHHLTGCLSDMCGYLPLSKDFAIFGGNENKVVLDIKGADTSMIAGDPAANAEEKVEQNKAVVIFFGLIVRGGADKVNHVDLIDNVYNGALILR